MKVIVCGSRGWKDERVVAQRVAALPADTIILHGGAEGPDIFAFRAALRLNLTAYSFLPEWKVYGKRAGFVRNDLMLDQEGVGLVIAFWDGSSRGTAYTIEGAEKRGIPTEVHEMVEVVDVDG